MHDVIDINSLPYHTYIVVKKKVKLKAKRKLKLKKRRISFWVFRILGIVGVLLVCFGLILLIPQNESIHKKIIVKPTMIPAPTTVPYVSPTPISVQFPQEFQKKFFDGNKMMHAN